jgi:hypothetical protein
MIAARCLLAGIIVQTVACATPDPALDQAARIIEPSAATREVVQAAVEEAVGVPVMLADDVFGNTSRLIIERRQHRHLEQGLVMGTDLSGPVEQFVLMRNGEVCLLVRQRDNSRWPLKGVHCVAE